MEKKELNLVIEDLNPTFLFTWKGTRRKDEERYHSHDYVMKRIWYRSKFRCCNFIK